MIHIWVRRTTDWADEAAFLAQLSPEFRPKVEVWNETFTVPFHLFRREVREIARLNLSRVEGGRVCAHLDEIPAGALVLPVDDDDWFAPDVGGVLERAREPGAIGYLWPSRFIEVPINFGHRIGLLKRALFPATPPTWICATNNYALVKGPETEVLLRSHTQASRWVEGQPPGRVKRVERCLSVMNRTLASQTSLGWKRPSIGRDELVRKLGQYRRLYARVAVPGCEWSVPYAALMRELTETLRVR